MGFHPAWKYESVIELAFEGGISQQEFDRSEPMAEIRQRFLGQRSEGAPDRRPTQEEIARFVEQAFDRTYRM